MPYNNTINCYEMLGLIRENIGEKTENHWSDVNLVKRINRAQAKVAMMFAMSDGGWLTKKSSLITPSSGNIALPSNCARLLYVKDTNNNAIPWAASPQTAGQALYPGTSYADNCYKIYPLYDSIQVNNDSYATGVYLYFQIRIPDLITGTGQSGGTTTNLVLQDDVNTVREDDYYNGIVFEIVTGTNNGTYVTATDYVASSITITHAAAGSAMDDTSVYGSVSLLPPEAMPLIELETTVSALAKPRSETETNALQYFINERREVKKTLNEWLSSRVMGSQYVENVQDY